MQLHNVLVYYVTFLAFVKELFNRKSLNLTRAKVDAKERNCKRIEMSIRIT